MRKKLNNLLVGWARWVYTHDKDDKNNELLAIILWLGASLTALCYIIIGWDIPALQMKWFGEIIALEPLECIKQILAGILIIIVVYGFAIIVPFAICIVIGMFIICVIPMLYLRLQMLFQKNEEDSK